MKTSTIRYSLLTNAPPMRWFLFLLSALVLSCGGGGANYAGVGTGGTGLKEGNVTGFGSVFIDGVRYDNSQAKVQVNDGSAALIPGLLKLGQRVRAQFNDAGQVDNLEILPALVGSVDQAPDAQGYFMVMGQWVRFVSKTLPYQGTLSSSTYLDGYRSFTGIAAADIVEVHGSWFSADPSKGQVLVASRIEKIAVMPERMLITGTVASVNPSDNSFRLKAADGREVTGASTQAHVGDWLKTWVSTTQIPIWSLANPVAASTHSTVSLPKAHNQTDAVVVVSGLPEQFDPIDNSVRIQGFLVRLQPSNLTAANRAALQSGIFSSFTLRLNAQSGSWIVQDITSREGDSLGGLTSFVLKNDFGALLASGVTVQNNGVNIQISQHLLQGSGCLTLLAGSTFTVTVTGSPEGSDVQADTLVCQPDKPP